MTIIDRTKLKLLPKTRRIPLPRRPPEIRRPLPARAKSLLGGVPMNWMKKWAGAFPVFVKSAKGAHFTDADGREYIDLCLGDTGA